MRTWNLSEADIQELVRLRMQHQEAGRDDILHVQKAFRQFRERIVREKSVAAFRAIDAEADRRLKRMST